MSDKAKDILFNNKARQKIFQGLHQVVTIIRKTIGPDRCNLSIDLINQAVEEIGIKDSFEKMGAEFAKLTAYKIKETSNDGIVTAIIILDSIVKEGIKLINANISPLTIKTELNLALKKIIAQIDSMTQMVADHNDIIKIVNSFEVKDKIITETIIECFKKVGKDGVIALEEANDIATTIKIVNGLEFDMGYSSAYFCTNSDKMTVEFNACDILAINQKILSIQEILLVLKQQSSSNNNLLIIVEDIQADVLSTLAMNKLKSLLKVAVIKVPFEKIKRKEVFEDIATLTGASVITELNKVTNSALGCAKKIIISKDKTIIIKAEIDELKTKKAKLEKRVAIISIGASNKDELKEKRQMFESCMSTAKAIIENGFVAGGGISLIFALDQKLNSGLKITTKLLKEALEAPFMQIITNAGHNPSPILEQVYQLGYPNGFNVLHEKVEDFFNANIIDSAMVIKNSLSHAISTASSILLTDALIVDAKE